LRSSSVDCRFVSVEFPAVSVMPQTNSHQSGLRPIPPLQRTTGENLTRISPLIWSTSYQMPVNTPVYVGFKHKNTPRSPKKETPQIKRQPSVVISSGTMFYENVIRQQMFRNAATYAKQMKSRRVRSAKKKSSSRITSYYIFIFDESLILSFLVTMYVIYMLGGTHSDSRLL
jgi:hypothetical protein